MRIDLRGPVKIVSSDPSLQCHLFIPARQIRSIRQDRNGSSVHGLKGSERAADRGCIHFQDAIPILRGGWKQTKG